MTQPVTTTWSGASRPRPASAPKQARGTSSGVSGSSSDCDPPSPNGTSARDREASVEGATFSKRRPTRPESHDTRAPQNHRNRPGPGGGPGRTGLPVDGRRPDAEASLLQATARPDTGGGRGPRTTCGHDVPEDRAQPGTG